MPYLPPNVVPPIEGIDPFGGDDFFDPARDQYRRATRRRAQFNRNQDAEGFADITRRGRNTLNRIALFEGIGDEDYSGRLEVLRARAARLGVDPSKFSGDAQGALTQMGMSGPVGSRMAGRLGAYYQIGRAKSAAKERVGRELAEGWGGVEDQFNSFLGGPIDPNSGAALAVGSNYVAGRKQALFDAMNDIDENAATAKAGLDTSTLSSIGDTLATLRALEEQKRFARMQSIFGGIGAAGSLLGGIGLLTGGGGTAPLPATA